MIAGFELLHERRIVAHAAHLLDLERQVADRVLEAGKAFGRLQFAQRLVHVGEPALHVADDRRIDAVLAALVEPPGDLAHFVFERFDGLLRHRFIELAGNLRQLLAEHGDLFVLFRLMQPLDQLGDVAQLAFEPGQILRRKARNRRWRRREMRGRRHRRHGAAAAGGGV